MSSFAIPVPIPSLPPATLPLTGAELVPLSQGGVTREASVSAIAAVAASPVSSVFSRTGAITAATGDYSFSQISGTITGAQLPALAGDVTSVAAATTVAKIQGTTVSGTTGSGNVVFATSPSISAPTITGHPTIEGVTTTGAQGTGAIVFATSPTITTPTISGHFTAEGVTTTGATGTGNLVFSASPTFTGTVTGAALTLSTPLVGASGGTGVANTGKTITLGGNLTTSGAFNTILTVTADTNVTLPVSGTLVNSAVTTLSSLVSIGTITTGVWTGTTIAVANGGTGLTGGTSGGIPAYTAAGTLTSSAALTANAVVVGGGAGVVPSTLAALGASGTVLTSNGAGVAPSFQAASGGNWIQIGSTQTASTSTEIDFTSASYSTAFDGTYNTLILDINALVPSGNLHPTIQIGTGAGPTYKTAGNYAVQAQNLSSGAWTSFANESTDTSIDLTGLNVPSTAIFSATIWLNNLSSGSIVKVIRWIASDSGGNGQFYLGSGRWTADTTAATAFRVNASASNFASGKFTLYGLTK